MTVLSQVLSSASKRSGKGKNFHLADTVELNIKALRGYSSVRFVMIEMGART